MTTTIVTNSGSAGASYTWDSYTLTWDDANSGAKTWDTAATYTWTLTIDETETVVDAIKKSTSKALAEAFATVDAIIKSPNKVSAETFTTSDGRSVSLSKLLAEAFATAEAISKNVNRAAFPEAFSVADDRTMAFNKKPPETIAFAEVLSLQDAFTRTFGESFAVADVRSVNVGKPLSESFAYADAIKKTVSKSLLEAFATVDARTVNYGKSLGEAYSFVDTSRTVSVGKNIPEAFQTVDAKAGVVFAKNLPHSFGFVDGYSRQVNFTRTFGESAFFADVRKVNVSKALSDAWNTRDILVRHGPIVVTDLTLRTDAITFAAFQNYIATDVPETYEPYVPFIIGDYTFKKANIKVKLTRENTTQDLRLTVGSVHVDVADVNDRGTAVITQTATVTHVTFNRVFAQAPVVTPANVSASAFAVPRISNITTTGFDAELVNGSNARVTGTLGWNALGF